MLALNFFLGFAVLTVEILGVRALAPFIGTSIPATSATIGTTVICLSFGYFLASYFEKKPPEKMIASALLWGGISLLASPLIIYLLKNFLFLQWEKKGWLLSFCVFYISAPFFIVGLSSIAFGFCAPLILEVITKEDSRIRKVAIQYFIFGGLGSLVGTVLPHVFLIPVLGTRLSFLSIGTLSIALGIWQGRKTKTPILEKVILALGVLGSSYLAVPRQPGNLLASIETPYQTIYVKADSRDKVALLYDRQLGVQSTFPHQGLFSNSFYADMLLPLQLAVGKKSYEVLVLGSAAATFSSLATSSIPNLQVTNVEIDPSLHQIAFQYFGAQEKNNRYITADARTFVNRRDRKYDHIFVDAYTKEATLPNQLATVEFFQGLSEIMNAEATVLLNIASENPIILKTMIGGLQKVFPYTYQTRALRNTFILASKKEVQLREIVEQFKPCENESLAGYDDNFSSEWIDFFKS